jgi:ligand-binding sensor domain-containing protein/serine phosphatase RsbU (regulator of sigma subunit)
MNISDLHRNCYRKYGSGVTLLLLFCWFHAPGQIYRVKEYGVNSGLPQPYVYSMDQDRSGYLWIGTGAGLARYDGNTFQVFTDSDSLCDNFITSSHITPRGSWFGHMNGGVSFYNGRIFRKTVAGDQGTGAVTDIKSTGNSVWVSTQSGGIWRIDPGQQPVLYSDPENQVSIFALELLSSTECLVGAIDGVYVYSMEHESGQLRLISGLEGIPETKIQDLLTSGNGDKIYILTQDEGIFTYNPRQYTLKTTPLEFDIEAGIEGPQQVYEDADLNLWVPTFGSGLFKLVRDEDGGFTSWINYTEENGLPGNNIRLVTEDREQNIWLGMYGTGLARLVDEAYTYYSFEDMESGNSIHSIFISDRFSWFGTETGVVRIDPLTGERTFMSGSRYGLPDSRITAIGGAAEGDLWVGTREAGLYRWMEHRGRFARYPISEGILENSISAVEMREGILWVATGKGVCEVNTGTGENRWFTISNAGLPHNTVNNLQVDRTGKVWLSTLSNAVSYIEDDSVTRITIPAVGAALDIRSVSMDSEGNIWVGTDGYGVLKLEGDTTVNFTTADGLISDYCYSLVNDDSRYIWITHRGGLSRIRLSDSYVSTVKDEMGIERNMEFNQNAVFKDPSGILWFGSTSGVLSYDPRMEKGEPPPPALSITSVTVNNEMREAGTGLELPPGRHDLKIQFVGVNLKNPDGVTYQYNMEGLGNAWSEAFSDPQVVFNRLPDGKYTFLLRAINSEGISSEDPVSFSIVIARPLWKRWWFYAIIVVLLASGIGAYIKRREYNLKMEKQALEQAVKERTEEVVKQKEEIELQRDAIKSQSDRIRLINKNITDSITYARRIQQAVFPPPEQLTALFPDSFILNRPQYIVSGDFFWLARKEDKLVVTVSDCTGHGVPGAFMSMLGITLLNELVNTQGIMEADAILNRLKHEIILALRQTGNSESASDGMDMALCVYDPDSSSLQFSGGFNPLVLVRKGELQMLKADPMPIGIGAITGRDFTRHDLEIRKGDVVYLYSDGYEDQFGGEKDKKFSRKRFRELLLEVHHLPMKDQKKTLESRLDKWMDGREQIDDITVMGIRF